MSKKYYLNFLSLAILNLSIFSAHIPGPHNFEFCEFSSTVVNSILLIDFDQHDKSTCAVVENNDALSPFNHDKIFPIQFLNNSENIEQKIVLRETVQQKLIKALSYLDDHIGLCVIRSYMTVDRDINIYGAPRYSSGGCVALTLVDLNERQLLPMGNNDESLCAPEFHQFTFAPSLEESDQLNRSKLLTAMSKAGFINNGLHWSEFHYGDAMWAYKKNRQGFYKTIDEEKFFQYFNNDENLSEDFTSSLNVF